MIGRRGERGLPRWGLGHYAVGFALGAGLAASVVLAFLGVVGEAAAAVLVLAFTFALGQFAEALRAARVRWTLAAELTRNLDDSLPTLAELRRDFAETVAGRLGRRERLFFAYSPDEDISLKIYGPMIPGFEPWLARQVMAYFDAENAACALLARLESPAFDGPSAERQADWLAATEDQLDLAVRGGCSARKELRRLYRRPLGPGVASVVRGTSWETPTPPRDHLIGQILRRVFMPTKIGSQPPGRQEEPGRAPLA